MHEDGNFSAMRFDFRIDDKNGLTPARRKRAERRPVNYNTLFKCKVCGNLFESRPALLAHKMEHTAFKCEYCDDTFQRKSIWKLHLSKVHNVSLNEPKKKVPESPASVNLPEPEAGGLQGPVPPLDVKPDQVELPPLISPPMVGQMPMDPKAGPVATPPTSYPNIPGFVCINVPIFITSGDGSNTTVTALPPGNGPPPPQGMLPHGIPAMANMPQGSMVVPNPFNLPPVSMPSMPSPSMPSLQPPPGRGQDPSQKATDPLEPGEIKKSKLPFSAPTPSMAYPMSQPSRVHSDSSSLSHVAPINRNLHKGPPSFEQAFRNFGKFSQPKDEECCSPRDAHAASQSKFSEDARIESYVIDLSCKKSDSKVKEMLGEDSDVNYDDERLALQAEYKDNHAASPKRNLEEDPSALGSRKKGKGGGGLSKLMEKLWQNRMNKKDEDLVNKSEPATHSRIKSHQPHSLSSSPAPVIVTPGASEETYMPCPESFGALPEGFHEGLSLNDTKLQVTEEPPQVIEMPPAARASNEMVYYSGFEEELSIKNENFCTLKFHTCPTCKQLFSTSEEMRKHTRDEHAVKRTRSKVKPSRKRMHCPSCNFITTSLFRMKHHQITTHPDKFNIVDLTSGSPSDKKEAVTQAVVETPAPAKLTRIKCRFPGCGRVFRELRQLRVHQTLHTCEKSLMCELCDYSCRHKGTLLWHMKAKHNVDRLKECFESQSPGANGAEMGQAEDAKPEDPPLESMDASVAAALNLQVKQAFAEPLSPRPEEPSHSEAPPEAAQRELSLYRIEASPGPDPQFFTSVMKFNVNKAASAQSEDSKQKCICKQCSQSFENAEEMWQHKVDQHPNDTKFLCDSCSYETKSRADLQSHMLSTHGNEVGDMKEYMCFICGKGYSSKRGLNHHLMRHSEEGPPGFDCPHAGCKSRLVSRSALKNHIRRVHVKNQEVKSSSGQLSGPESPGDKCGSVLLHCDFEGCDKAFRESKHLKVHRMQHTDERPLKCELCFYSCRQRNSMNWHMKSKHGMDKHVTADGRTIYLTLSPDK